MNRTQKSHGQDSEQRSLEDGANITGYFAHIRDEQSQLSSQSLLCEFVTSSSSRGGEYEGLYIISA